MTVSGAGSAPARSSADSVDGLLDGEAAADLAGAAGDRLADDRRRQHLAVEHDGEGPADIGAGDLGEFSRADAVEAEGDQRLVRALVEAGARVGQVLAVERDAVFDRILRARLGVGQHGDATRQWLAIGGVRQHVERHLGGRAEQLAQPRRVLQARQLDEHAVRADALDRRLGDADLVDALAHDLEALLQRRVEPVVDAGVGQRDLDEIAVGGDVEVLLAADANRRRHGAEHFLRLCELIRIVDGHRDGAGRDARRAGVDALLAQRAAHIVEQRAQPVGLQRRGVDLEHEVRSALQVEAERDLLFGHPVRQGRELLGREHVGERGDDAGKNEDDVSHHHPSWGSHVC